MERNIFEGKNIKLEILQTGLGADLVEGLFEWSLSGGVLGGGVEKTWKAKLGRRPLPANVANCFSRYNTCLL